MHRCIVPYRQDENPASEKGEAQVCTWLVYRERNRGAIFWQGFYLRPHGIIQPDNCDVKTS